MRRTRRGGALAAAGLAAMLWSSEARADDASGSHPAPAVTIEPSVPATVERARIETDAGDLTLGTVLQLDAANGGDRPGFSMHRARLSLHAQVERLQGLGGFLQLGVGATDEPSPLLDAVIRFRVVGKGGPNFGELQLGQRKVPVSREVLRDPVELAFVDRAPMTELAPGRDLGLLYHLSLARPRRRFSLDVGFWNGEGAAGRAVGRSMTSIRVSAGAGDAGRARPGMDWGFAYAVHPDVTGPARRGKEAVLALDGEIRYRALTVGAESISVARERGTNARGLFGTVGWYLIADTLELRARGEMLDDEEVVQALTFGLTFYYLAPRLRLMIDHTEVLRGESLNDGRTVTSFLFVL